MGIWAIQIAFGEQLLTNLNHAYWAQSRTPNRTKIRELYMGVQGGLLFCSFKLQTKIVFDLS